MDALRFQFQPDPDLPHWRQYYSLCWQARGELFHHLYASGETSLPRLMAVFDRLSACYRTDVIHQDGVMTGEVYLVPDVQAAQHPWAKLNEQTAHVVQGHYQHLPAYMRFDWQEMIAGMLDYADCVMELGSGYGKQLFGLYHKGVSQNIHFVAGEPTPGGRELTSWLGALEPGMDLEVTDFSFERPSLSCLHPYSRCVLFSAWSVMYAASVPSEFFDELAAVPGDVHCLFYEPLGFQMGGDDPRQQLQQADALMNGHNQDFHSALLKAAEQGLVTLHYLGQDYFAPSVTEPKNLMSVWAFSKPARPA